MSHEDNITKASLSQRIHELESRLAANEAAYDEAYLISVAAKNDANALREELAVAVEALENALSVLDGSSVGGAISGEIAIRDALAKIKETK